MVLKSVSGEVFTRNYASVFDGDDRWRNLPVPAGDRYAWDPSSTYVARPPFFDGLGAGPSDPDDIVGARALAVLGDSVTTDHISPAGSIARTSPAGEWLIAHGVDQRDFNSYGARRGHHEVMMRGTFANIRLRNLLTPDAEGNVTEHLPSGERMSIFDAAERYRADGTPLVVLAGKEYGSGSSRDWAAKGPLLQGVRAVIAESYERIHRSNLVGMGILPLQFLPGESVASLGLTGRETFEVTGLADGLRPRMEVAVTATRRGRSRGPLPDGGAPRRRDRRDLPAQRRRAPDRAAAPRDRLIAVPRDQVAAAVELLRQVLGPRLVGVVPLRLGGGGRPAAGQRPRPLRRDRSEPGPR